MNISAFTCHFDVDNKLIVNDVDSYGNSWKKDPKFKIPSSRVLENLYA